MENKIKNQTPTIILCECSSREHQIIFEYDNEDNLVYCNIHLVKYRFFKRLKEGLKYIFGYKCKYGNFEEFVLKKEHANTLLEISGLLNKDN